MASTWINKTFGESLEKNGRANCQNDYNIKSNFSKHANSVLCWCDKFNGVKSQKMMIRWSNLIYGVYDPKIVYGVYALCMFTPQLITYY